MGEIVAWGLGPGLRLTVRTLLNSRLRILFFAIAIILLGALIPIVSGEIASRPWHVFVDIGRMTVTVAALMGAFALALGPRRLCGAAAH